MNESSKKKKILFFDLHLQYLYTSKNKVVGGAATQQFSWVEGFVKNNYNIGILVFENNYENIICNDPNITFIKIYDENKGIPKFRFIFYRIPLLFSAILKYKPCYIYQACSGFNTALAAIISQIVGSKFIFRSANDIDSDDRYKKRLNLKERLGYNIGLKRAKFIACQNNYQFLNFKKKFPTKSIFKIYNPIKLSFLYETSFHPFNYRKYIAWIGIFQHQKNLNGLLELVQNLSTFNFKIAGVNSYHIDHITQSAISKLKECNNVEFVGFIGNSQKEDFFSNAICLLNTSHYEGFSNTFLEAFCFGTPVFTTTKVDPDNIIKKNSLGIVKDNLRNLIKELDKLNSKSHNEMQTNCISYVKNHHNPINLAKTFINKIENR